MCRVRSRWRDRDRDRDGNRDRDGAADAVLRAVVAVGLLAAAALALQARQGLDWGALADPVQVRWARLLPGLVLLAAVGALARRLLRRMRRPRVGPRQGLRAEPEPEAFPWLLRVLAAVLCLAALGAAWFVADALTGPVEQAAPSPSGDPAGDGPPSPLSTDWPVLVLVAGVLVAAWAAARVLAGRRLGDAGPDADTAAEADVAQLVAAVHAAEAELDGHDDARAAIVAAYGAMAASLEAGLRRHGGLPRASDTPTELLERAAAAGLVGSGPAATLTSLFREARFSRHPMGLPERRAAEEALGMVREELVARHV